MSKVIAILRAPWLIGRHAKRLGTPYIRCCRSCKDDEKEEMIIQLFCDCLDLCWLSEFWNLAAGCIFEDSRVINFFHSKIKIVFNFYFFDHNESLWTKFVFNFDFFRYKLHFSKPLQNRKKFLEIWSSSMRKPLIVFCSLFFSLK